MRYHVLITGITLAARTGVPLYIRDLAFELKRQGHIPSVYTLEMGVISSELEKAGIIVVNNCKHLELFPDVIQGSHFATTLSAVQHFPNVPAIFVCHDHRHWHDRAPLHHQVRRYFGVSRACVLRIAENGAPKDRIDLLPNFVDVRRFSPRGILPERPQKALIFSNYARADTHLQAIVEVCRRTGLKLDVVGKGVGNEIAEPEKILGQYDIVFAKAKAAMEAMSVGCAVVLCDFSGVGPMVNSEWFDKLRLLNFGFEALCRPLTPGNIEAEIKNYNIHEAAKVSDLIRQVASLEQFVKKIVIIYREIIDEQKDSSSSSTSDKRKKYNLSTLFLTNLIKGFAFLSPAQRDLLKRIPIACSIIDVLKKFLVRIG